MKKNFLILLFFLFGVFCTEILAEELLSIAKYDLRFLTYTESRAFLLSVCFKFLGYLAILYAGALITKQRRENVQQPNVDH
jgi:hypothetical protein